MKTVPQAEPTPHHRLRAELPLKGKPKRNRAARIEDKRLLPRIQKLSPLCISSLSVVAPGLPVTRGVSGGGDALSSLCRRFPGGDIMNLTSRRSPLSGLSFFLFFFLRERKRGYWRRRSREISVGKTKPDSEPSPRRGRQIWCNFPWAKRGKNRGKTGDDRMKNPCYTVTARDEIPRWHCGAAGNLSASERNTSLRTVLPKALFRRLPTGRFRLG